MSGQNESDSSDQQGFYANKIQIKHQNLVNCATKINWKRIIQEANAFQTRYLPWTGVFRKQPKQALKVRPIIPHQQNDDKQKHKKKTKKVGDSSHPYYLYAKNQQYTLVYSRKKQDPITNAEIFIRNQVMLPHIGNKSFFSESKVVQFQLRNQYDQLQNLPSRLNTLKLDSRFECGNLHCAYKANQSDQYILFVQNDTNSLGYNQWFYFSVEDNKAKTVYTFKIVNLKKKHSFFKYGAKPAVFSLQSEKQTKNGWSKFGCNISYQQSPIGNTEDFDQKYYCLSFDLTFQHENDYILIAMQIPYSYTKLTNFLKQISVAPQIHSNLDLQITSISKSICRNDIPEITISSKQTSENEQKKMIIIMARQHPGEVLSSYMMEGIIRYLTGMPQDWEHSKNQNKMHEHVNWILKHYIIKIYPMLNVDGVIYGNFRCDITGTDLNRKWKGTSKLIYPQIYDIKHKIRLYSLKYKIQCCFDLHGHSKNYNIFCYSCKINTYTCRILPKIMSDLNPSFYLPSCTFGISKYKITTARAVIFSIIKNQNILTIQTSFYGTKLNGVVAAFKPKDIYIMGQDIINSLRYFLDNQSKIYRNAKTQIQNNIRKYLKYDEANVDESGSDSDPQADQIQFQVKMSDIFDPKFINQKILQFQQSEEVDEEYIVNQQEKQSSRMLHKNQKRFVINKHLDLKSVPKQKNIITKSKNKIKNNQTINIQSPLRRRKNTSMTRNISQEQKKIHTISDVKSDNKKTAFSTIRKKQSIDVPVQINEQSRKQIKQRKPASSFNYRQRIQKLRPIQTLDLDYPTQIEQSCKKQEDEKSRKQQKINRLATAIKFSNQVHGSLFDQQIYDEDQSPLLSVLFTNKRKLELEKSKKFSIEVSKIKERSQTIQRSDRIRKLFNRSGNQLASIVGEKSLRHNHF